MNITELRKAHNERIINLVVSDIVVAGLGKLMDTVSSGKVDKTNPLTESWAKCLEDISESKWDDIRAVIKRSL